MYIRPVVKHRYGKAARLATADASSAGSSSASSVASTSSSPAPRKRHVLDSDADTSDDDRPIKPKPKADLRDFFGSTYSARPAAPVAKKRKTAAVPGGGLSQMVLDISDRPTTATCAECSMSYSRIAPEDVALHRTFHDNVVGGIDWPSKLGKGVTVLEDGLGPKRADRIMAVEASSTGALGRKIADILSTVDRELSASSLSSEQLADARVYLYVSGGSKSKCLAAAVASRIEIAHAVLSMRASTDGDGTLRFGEEDGAVFASLDAVPAIVGIHRIWTARSARRRGLASRLLDAVAKHWLYGGQRVAVTQLAFSQPTQAGAALARAWTGLQDGGWSAFVE